MRSARHRQWQWARLAAVVALAAWRPHCAAQVAVIRISVPVGEERGLLVNSSTEYILEFEPTAEQAAYPMRVWAQVEGGGHARPLLLTARTAYGAQTWQLPYDSPSGDHLLYELERTLCAPNGPAHSDDPCVADDEETVRGEFTLHVSSACVTAVPVRVRAAPLRDWALRPGESLQLRATETAAAVARYEFAEDEDSVLLVFAAEDDSCAVFSVHDYECPIPETTTEVQASGLRMTVIHSGAVQLSRQTFPRGFVAVCTVLETDEKCAGKTMEETSAAGWKTESAPPVRVKEFTVRVQRTLSRFEYAVAALVTVAAFGAFYAAAGAVLVARRLPGCRRLLAPRAPLADVVSSSTAGVDSEGGHAGARRRRDSTATYDSCDVSDTDSEEERAAATRHTPVRTGGGADGGVDGGVDGGGAADSRDIAMAEVGDECSAGDRAAAAGRPFGLPARLNVAALSRRRAATLRARSDRYLYTLYTVAVFYSLPVVQFVICFQIVLNVYGSLDLCYFNYLCAHPAGALSDFNHVFSNLGYLLLGALFMLHVRRRRAYRRKYPKHEEYGIPAHYGLLSALGAGMMVVALLSASYHVCPNQLNFQFDTAFMYVLAVLSMVKIYQARHPDINARAHATFGVLAVLIALVVWGVVGGGNIFWAAWSVLHAGATLLLSLRIYYVGQFRLDKQSLAETRRGLLARPLYGARLAQLAAANAVNWAYIFWGLFTAPDFPSHLLFVLLSNTLVYMLSYILMKLVHGERLRWYAWVLLAGAAGCWAPALYFFAYGSSDWAATPALSRHQNHECMVLQFYDAHDLWHALSAAALYLSFCAMLTWDDGLSAIKRTEIAVF